MRTLRAGSSGEDVRAWQTFLRGVGLYMDEVDGRFGPLTLEATLAFQRAHGLVDDGIVGNRTFGAAMQLGLDLAPEDPAAPDTLEWPPKPSFGPLGEAGRRTLFGSYDFRPAPTPENPEAIEILGTWVADNIRVFAIRELEQVKYANGGHVAFHRDVGPRVEELFARWDEVGLVDRVLTWGGSFAARFVRGSRTVLSSHAHGSAFDVNVPWNALGAVPARRGAKGSVRELVPIANGLGFWWGGHFDGRRDGMHFEVGRV